MRYHIVLFIFILNSGISLCQTGTNLNDLLTQLFTTNSYNVNARPSNDQTVSTLVSVDYYLAGITSLDEIAEKFTTTGYLSITWTDDYLTWTPGSYGNIQEFYYPQGNVWKPDISVQNGFSKMHELGSSFVVVNVQSTGTVLWEPFELFETRCNVDTTFFPFDKQTCDLIFVCWSYKSTDVNMTVGSNGVQLYEDFTSNGEWSVTATSYNVDHDGFEVKITFSITVQRKPQYFVLNIMIPVVMVSLLNLLTFVIPCESGERLGYAITVWLTFAVFLTIVSGSLPKSGDTTSIIAIYLMLMLSIATLVVTISAIQIRAGFYSEEEKKIPNIIKRIVLYINKKKNHVEDIKGPGSTEEKLEYTVTWKEVITAFDFIFFWSGFILIFLITLICFCYVAAN